MYQLFVSTYEYTKIHMGINILQQLTDSALLVYMWLNVKPCTEIPSSDKNEMLKTSDLEELLNCGLGSSFYNCITF